MAFLPVVTFGTKVLKTRVQPIEDIDDSVRQLAADMVETMHQVNGLGLAATQVGRSVAMFVINGPAAFDEDGSSDRSDLVIINPEIKESRGRVSQEEGCLSVPGIRLDVNRYQALDLEYTGLDGQRRSLHAEGLLARVIQHETDHLNGMLIVDRISPLKRQLIKTDLQELEAQVNAGQEAET